MKKIWRKIDGWRGYYEPVPPNGYELLLTCHVVNEAGEQLRKMLSTYLRKKKISFRSGYLQTSNAFAASIYFVVEKGKLSAELKQKLEDWYVDFNNSTFSIFSGESRKLDKSEAGLKLFYIFETDKEQHE